MTYGKVLIVAVLILTVGFIAGCTINSEQQEKLDAATETVWEGVESGELSINEAKALIAEIQEVSGSGVPWWEIILSVAGGVALRGIPSKGPLMLIGNLFRAKKK